MESLILLSLGPIQDFIASARRCQDLWFGSWLLSDLARRAATAVDQDGATVIFPAGLAASRERPGVANLILARISAPPAEVAARVRAAVDQGLQEVADRAFQGLPAELFHEQTARRQLGELMELLWVAEPLDAPYAQVRKRLYRRMAARKNTRPWSQPTWDAGAGVPKSSLDGERESVIDERVYDSNLGWSTDRRRRVFGLKGAERLCGVGLLKRRGVDLELEGRPPFHSTAHMAMVPTMERLDGRRAAVGDYLKTLAELGLDLERFRVRQGGPPTLLEHDGSLLLESRLDDHFRESGSPPAASAPPEAARALRRLLRGRTPCPYYAFLLADGDRMGAAIDAIDTIEGHQRLGQALNEFAKSCRDIVEGHRGSLIFSGGDDVLALLPLHRCLDAAVDLRKEFIDRVGSFGAPGAPLSLSVGIGIAHCREPMGEARELARRAERMAKQSGRNALALLLDRRSGSELALVGSFDDEYPLAKRLKDAGGIVDKGELAAKAAHDLEEVAAHYEGADTAERAEEIRALARQVLSRKRRVGGAEAIADTLLEKLLARIEGQDPARRVRELSAELQLARLLQRAAEDARERGYAEKEDAE